MITSTVLSTPNPQIRLIVEHPPDGEDATIRTQQRTPEGYEDIDAEVVAAVNLRDVLVEWYDIPAQEVARLRH